MINATLVLERFTWQTYETVLGKTDFRFEGPLTTLNPLPDPKLFYHEFASIEPRDSAAVKSFLQRYGPLTLNQKEQERATMKEFFTEQEKLTAGLGRITLVTCRHKELFVKPAGLIDYMRLVLELGEKVFKKCLNPECEKYPELEGKKSGAKYCSLKCQQRTNYLYRRMFT